MPTFVLIHGAADTAWYWHLLTGELQGRGHAVVAMDLPCDDDSAGLTEYADVVIDSIGNRTDLIVVAQSFGGFTAPLVCDRVPVTQLVLLAAMIPTPGERPGDWWANTGYEQAVDGSSEDDDPIAIFMQDAPAAIAAEALRRTRDQSATPMGEPWPLKKWPDVSTKVLACRRDRMFPLEFIRRIAHDRLGITPDEIDGDHSIALSHPRELAERLNAYAAEL
jgi:pimeloyl-ACP methyl ester carboxylesterase